MAQLKSFKYLETDDSESTSPGKSESLDLKIGQERQVPSKLVATEADVITKSDKAPRRHSSDNVVSSLQTRKPPPAPAETSHRSNKQFDTSKPIELSSYKYSAPSSSSASSSLVSTIHGGTSTVIGGALTTDNSSQSSTSDTRLAQRPSSTEQLSSNEEYQSARIDLNEDDDDDDEQYDKVSHGENLTLSSSGGDGSGSGSVKGDQSNKENHDAQPGEAGSNITKIRIEHPNNQRRRQQNFSTSGNGNDNLDRFDSRQPLTPAKTPLTPRLKSPMPRSQTSPSLAQAKSPKLVRGVGVAAAAVAAGDNTSQWSFAMHQQAKGLTANHFEIRWQNVKLYARPKSRLPRSITDSLLYRTLFGSSGSDGDELHVEAPCYSPPVQHKIPPTIDECLEMEPAPASQHTQSGGGLSGASASANRLVRSASTSPLPPPSPSPAGGVRCILNSVSGQVFSGQMTAILGPSGVGKTSLLNSLTGRNTLDGTGRVSLISASDSKRMSVVTVPQNDVLPSKLTTLEDLQFTSRLKNPQSKFDHQANIERIAKHLHMDKFLNTPIEKLSGGEARRLSIARELLNSPDILILDEPTSGLDANTCKKIITALRNIVEHSDNILDKPMSIIITIHQPQQEVYNLFHRVYVMAVGGRAIYEGPPQMLRSTLLECSSLSRVCQVDQLNENPAIVAIEVASGEYGPDIINELAVYHENQLHDELVAYPSAGKGGTELDSPLTTPQIMRKPYKSPLSVARFDMTQQRKRLNSFDSSIGRPTPVLAKRQLPGSTAAANQFDRMSSITSISYASTYDADLPEQTSKLKIDKRLRRSVVMKSNFWSHTATLIERCWLMTKRDIFLMAIRILGFLLVAAGTVQIYAHTLDPEEHQCPKFESEVDNIYTYMGELRTRLISMLTVLRQANSTHSFFFHILLCITMVTAALTGLVFPMQMRMFMREYKNGWYSPASFITSQTIAELPADMIGPLLTLLITYPLCHQPDSMYHWREIGYAIVFVVSSIICKSQAQIVGAFLMDSIENSVFISCVCVAVPTLLSGIPIRISQMMAPLQWASYGSFLRYSFESLLSLRYGYGMCPCDADLVNGYPVTASASALPPHLDTIANGFIALYQPASDSSEPVANETTTSELTTLSSGASAQLIGDQENLFLRFIRLLSDASNMFLSGTEIGTCSSYRSLYLISSGTKSDAFTNWIVVLLVMFVISRFLTYFVVKTVIKLRRS